VEKVVEGEKGLEDGSYDQDVDAEDEGGDDQHAQ